jgi:hypothetical protein
MKILVTNYFLRNFTGSEINALQICIALRTLGYEAEAATFFYDEPIKRKFQERNITVKNLLHEDLRLDEYDLFWAHHFHTLNHIVINSESNSSKVIYSCLGPFSSLAAPPTYHNELNFILSNSQGNNEVLLSEGLDKTKIRYFPNFSPRIFYKKAQESTPGELTRIGVISNHPPQEIINFAKFAQDNGLMVEFIGQDANKIYVDPDIITKYDLIISIGKTVQYCFSLKVPIYCYDHFGGPGFITPDNIQFEEYFNFSGRGTNKKRSGQELLDDIRRNYAGACSHLDFLFSYSKEHFMLEYNIQKLFNELALSKEIDLSRIREKYPLTKRHHKDFLRMLRKQLNHEENIALTPMHQTPEPIADSTIIQLEQEVLSYSLSRSWRVTRPFRKISKCFKKDKNA